MPQASITKTTAGPPVGAALEVLGLPLKRRAWNWREAFEVAFGRLVRGSLVVMAFLLLVFATEKLLPQLPASAAYALGGWVAALKHNSMVTTGLCVVLWWVVFASLRRRRGARTLQLANRQWELLGKRKLIWSCAARDITWVKPVSPWLVRLLLLVPGCPQRWRPVTGPLAAWLCVRTRGWGFMLFPAEQPAHARMAILLARDRVAKSAPDVSLGEPAPRRARAFLRSVAATVAGIALLLVCCLWANIVMAPKSQGWISEWPARIALNALAPALLSTADQTEVLRSAVAAGNPRIVQALLDAFGDSAHKVEASQLLDAPCTRSLTELAALDDTPPMLTKAQRSAYAASMKAVLLPFEATAQLVLPREVDSLMSVYEFQLAGNFDPACASTPPPYLAGRARSIEALWPRDEQQRPLQAPAFDLAVSSFDELVQLALSADALDTHARDGLGMTPLMRSLVRLRDTRAELAALPPNAHQEARSKLELRTSRLAATVAAFLADGQSDIEAVDHAGRSVAYLAAQAGESRLLRLAVQGGHVRSILQRSRSGATLLHAAALAGTTEDVLWLLARGLGADVRDLDGRTPLHLASNVPTALVLVARGAPLQATDLQGRAPLDAAINREEVAAALRAAGARRAQAPDAQ
jgi:ankyrin repeat protein